MYLHVLVLKWNKFISNSNLLPTDSLYMYRFLICMHSIICGHYIQINLSPRCWWYELLNRKSAMSFECAIDFWAVGNILKQYNSSGFFRWPLLSAYVLGTHKHQFGMFSWLNATRFGVIWHYASQLCVLSHYRSKITTCQACGNISTSVCT